MNKAPGAAAGSYRTGRTGKAFIRGIMLLILLLSLLPRAESADWVPVTGKVMYGDTPLCAMVIANGQNMFTCSGDGSFNLSLPLDKNGQVTLFTFAQGFAPYRQTLSPAQVANITVDMFREPESRTLSVNYSTSDAQRSDWVEEKTVYTAYTQLAQQAADQPTPEIACAHSDKRRDGCSVTTRPMQSSGHMAEP